MKKRPANRKNPIRQVAFFMGPATPYSISTNPAHFSGCPGYFF